MNRNGLLALVPCRFKATCLAVVALALGLACTAGCRSGNSRGTMAPPMLGMGGSAKLSPRQVADLQMVMARSLESRGDLTQASAAYQEVLRQDPSRADACLRLAVMRDQQGRFTESAELYRKALAAMPGNADTYCNMGYSLYLQKRWNEAEMNLRQAVALNREHARAHNNLGLVLGHQRRLAEALVAFRAGGCSEADAQCNLAFVLTMDRRLEEARLHYEMALASNPSSPVVRKRLHEVETLLARSSPPAEAPQRNVVVPAPEVIRASHVTPATEK